jgi:hypothetical protein
MSVDDEFSSAAPVVDSSKPGQSIEERFENFHANNPHVYELLVSLARKAKARGRDKIGMKMLYEVARWHFYLNANSEEDYALNNDYTSRYARMIADKEPDLTEMFEFRKLKTP